MAGRFSLKPANSYGLTGGTELGYRLHPAFWGRGLATEGAQALIESAFERLHLDRIVATTMADNTGSWRVLESAGCAGSRRSATRTLISCPAPSTVTSPTS